MRTRTFVFSFLVHCAVLSGAMAVRIFATTELPDPPLATKFMMAVAAEPPDVPPPPARQVTQSTAPTVDPSAIPVKAPDTLAPEIPRESPDSNFIGAGVIIGDGSGVPGGIGEIGPPPPPRVETPQQPRAPVRVGTGVRAPQKIHHVAPKYPELAVRAHVDGVVILEALIAEDGSVRDVKVLRSKALLDAAAIDAVRQWRFTPTLLNGTPVPVIMTVTVTFNLN